MASANSGSSGPSSSMGDPKLSIAGSEVEAARNKLETDFGLKEKKHESSLSVQSFNEPNETKTLFEQIHYAHWRYLKSGKLESSSAGGVK